MDALTRFEIRKIIKRKTFIIGAGALVAVILFLISMTVNGAWILDQDGKDLSGLDAIKLRKEYDSRLAGPLTVEKLEDAIERYQNVINDPRNKNDSGELTTESYAKYEVKDEQIFTLIRYAFSSLSGYDHNILAQLRPSDMEGFYQKRLEKVIGYLNFDYSYGNYSADEISFFIKLNAKIPVPLQMDYIRGWQEIFKYLQSVFLIISLVIAICLAPVFSGEYQSGAVSIILSSRYGRNKVIFAKFKASLFVATSILFFAMLLYTLLFLGFYGFKGGSASVQLIDLLAPVPYTILETYLWTLFIGSLACMVVGAVTLWLSSLFKHPFHVMVAIGIFLFGPLFIPASKSSRLFNQVLGMFPGNMVDSFKKITGYELFYLFGQMIPLYKVMAGTAVLIIAILIPCSYRIFKKHQVI